MTPPKPKPPKSWPWVEASDDPDVWDTSPVLNPANFYAEKQYRRERAQRLQEAQREAVLNMGKDRDDGPEETTGR